MTRASFALQRGAPVVAVVLLAGCGYFSGSSPDTTAHSAPKRPKSHLPAPPPVDPAAKALAGMVEAVAPSGSQAAVDLRFSIHDRPQVGQDDEIDYAVIPEAAGIATIHLAFGSLDGLKVVSHGPALAAIKPATGVPIFGSVTIRPLKAGLFTLTAAVAVESPNQSVVWPFSIPVIAGEGPAQTAANTR